MMRLKCNPGGFCPEQNKDHNCRKMLNIVVVIEILGQRNCSRGPLLQVANAVPTNRRPPPSPQPID